MDDDEIQLSLPKRIRAEWIAFIGMCFFFGLTLSVMYRYNELSDAFNERSVNLSRCQGILHWQLPSRENTIQEFNRVRPQLPRIGVPQ